MVHLYTMMKTESYILGQGIYLDKNNLGRKKKKKCFYEYDMLIGCPYNQSGKEV